MVLGDGCVEGEDDGCSRIHLMILFGALLTFSLVDFWRDLNKIRKFHKCNKSGKYM